MKTWLARRFKWVRELEESNREKDIDIRAMREVEKYLRGMITEYQGKEVKFSKLTLDEAEELFSCVVDYQRALKTLCAADPVQHRIEPLMKKYEIKIERNTIADSVRGSA